MLLSRREMSDETKVPNCVGIGPVTISHSMVSMKAGHYNIRRRCNEVAPRRQQCMKCNSRSPGPSGLVSVDSFATGLISVDSVKA